MRFAGDKLVGAGIGGGFDTSNLAGKMGMKVGGDVASITIAPAAGGGFTRYDRNDGDNSIYYAPRADHPRISMKIGEGNRKVAYPEGEGPLVSLNNARQVINNKYVKDGHEVSSQVNPVGIHPPILSKGKPEHKKAVADYQAAYNDNSWLSGTNVYNQTADGFVDSLDGYGAKLDANALDRINAMRGR